jgi:hypothetical protein
MSTYQYYEFQAIDRPLTAEEQKAVAQLSSRVEPHPRQAVFVYHWSGFPGNSREILAKYYDAMLYMANWGSRCLMFRFPVSALDLEEVQAYCQPLIVQDYLSLSIEGEYAILNVEFNPEDSYDWIEGEGWLPAMLPLRDDILQGDYQTLYLAWLRMMEFEDLLDSVPEPPVPSGLEDLSPALRSFIDFFEIDEMLVQVAAEASSQRQAQSQDWLRQAISQLSSEECNAFLLRLAQRETSLSAKLNRRLRQVAPLPEPEVSPRRTVGQLVQETEERREREHRRRVAEAEAQRIRELKALAKRESETWTEIFALIEQMQAKPYAEAVRLLVKLRDLAEYQGEEAAFQQRLNRIYEQYSRRSALLRRLREAGLQQS